MRVLLTGATGFLGRELLARLLARGADTLVVTRPRPSETVDEAGARIARMVRECDPAAPTQTLKVALGDVTHPELGLDASARRWLDSPGEAVHVIHGAAEVRFDLPYDVMRRQNVEGTKNVLEVARRLAAAGNLARFDHVSTAYVAGDRAGVVFENEVDTGQRPRNDYERTKLEAEVEVARARGEGLPVVVHRPSIIVGDSRTGRASSFKVLYWPMKVYARGRWRTIFGRPECVIDVVPVDFVANAMMDLLQRPEAVGQIFHLAAGRERQSSICELVAAAEGVFGRGRIRYVDPDLYMRWLRPVVRPVLRRLRPEVAERGGVYLPYLRSNPSFSTANTQALLAAGGVVPPRVADYFEMILRYARDTDFGRRAA